jgi:hypothetical protein
LQLRHIAASAPLLFFIVCCSYSAAAAAAAGALTKRAAHTVDALFKEKTLAQAIGCNKWTHRKSHMGVTSITFTAEIACTSFNERKPIAKANGFMPSQPRKVGLHLHSVIGAGNCSSSNLDCSATIMTSPATHLSLLVRQR